MGGNFKISKDVGGRRKVAIAEEGLGEVSREGEEFGRENTGEGILGRLFTLL